MSVKESPNFLHGLEKSFSYLFRDSRKLAGLIFIILLPIVENIWKMIPKGISFPYYDELHIFIYTFTANFVIVLLGLGWFFTIPRKDFALQLIVLAGIMYGLFATYTTFPITVKTSVWIDVLAITLMGIFIFVCIYYIRNYYLNRPVDYKVLHDGLIHDIHHEKFMSEVSRLEGLIAISDMTAEQKKMGQEEVRKLRQSLSYISEKYSELK
jgi:hypothetical protein